VILKHKSFVLQDITALIVAKPITKETIAKKDITALQEVSRRTRCLALRELSQIVKRYLISSNVWCVQEVSSAELPTHTFK
jgi:hypothetical protein